jgi:hypothetical protein
VLVDPQDAKRVLQANIAQAITLVLSDEAPFSATVLTVDDEGFVYSVEENGTKNLYWTRFEAVVSIEPISPAEPDTPT